MCVCVCTVWKKKRVGGRARKWAQNCCYAFFLCLLLLLLWSRDLKGEEEREKIKCENVFSVANCTHPWRSERTLAVASSTHEEMRSALSLLSFSPLKLPPLVTNSGNSLFLALNSLMKIFFCKKIKDARPFFFCLYRNNTQSRVEKALNDGLIICRVEMKRWSERSSRLDPPCSAYMHWCVFELSSCSIAFLARGGSCKRDPTRQWASRNVHVSKTKTKLPSFESVNQWRNEWV